LKTSSRGEGHQVHKLLFSEVIKGFGTIVVAVEMHEFHFGKVKFTGEKDIHFFETW
jgi:hypothetical protein